MSHQPLKLQPAMVAHRDSFFELLERLVQVYEADLQKASRGGIPRSRRRLSPARSPMESQPLTSGPLFESGMSLKPPTSFSMPAGCPPPLRSETARSQASGLGPTQSQQNCSSDSPPVKVTGPLREESSVDELGELHSSHEQMRPRACFAHKPPSARLKSVNSVQLVDRSRLGSLQQHGCALSPSGSFRNTWDLIGVVCLVWDLLIIPLQMFDLHSDVPGRL